MQSFKMQPFAKLDGVAVALRRDKCRYRPGHSGALSQGRAGGGAWRYAVPRSAF